MNLATYRDYLNGQGLAPRTVNTYTTYLRRLTVWAHNNNLTLDSLAPHHIRTWSDDTIPASWASRKQAHMAVAKWAEATSRSDQPQRAVRVPAKPKPSPKPLTRDQSDLLRDAALMIGGRPGLATIIGLYTAARASEICAMRWDGIDPQQGTIRWWRTKNQDWKQIPMHPILAATLEQHRKPTSEGFIFAGNNGSPHVKSSTVWSWVRNIGRTIGIEVRPHQLRSTAGWKVLEATGSIELAASLLGHESVDTTRKHYTGLASEARLNDAIAVL